jgi:hypothetical protein
VTLVLTNFSFHDQNSNVVFPWPQTLAGAAHPSADLTPEQQWDAIPLGAKWQIFAVISALELWDECGGGYLPHYMKGRKPGQYPKFDGFRDAVHPGKNNSMILVIFY